MAAKPVQIDGRLYPSITAAEERAQRALYAGVPGSIVEEPDAAFVRAMFKGRTGKDKELDGHTVANFTRMTNRYGTTSFYARLNDGSLLDFSFKQAIKNMAETQDQF